MHPFTQQQLYQVRNKIDINKLISDQLHLERQFNGMWRFKCPLCQQFNTATQTKTNLSRCFSCQKNFNTIDLVIYSKKLNFIPSVNFLLALLDTKIQHKNNHSGNVGQKEMNVMNKESALQAIEKMKQILT